MNAKIEQLREAAAIVARLSNEDSTTPETRAKLREELKMVEEKIEKLLSEYIELPDCPYLSCSGKLISTTIRRTFTCNLCGAFVVPGRTSAE